MKLIFYFCFFFRLVFCVEWFCRGSFFGILRRREYIYVSRRIVFRGQIVGFRFFFLGGRVSIRGQRGDFGLLFVKFFCDVYCVLYVSSFRVFLIQYEVVKVQFWSRVGQFFWWAMVKRRVGGVGQEEFIEVGLEKFQLRLLQKVGIGNLNCSFKVVIIRVSFLDFFGFWMFLIVYILEESRV